MDYEIQRKDYAQSANALFHFMKEIEYLRTILQKKALIPRYCKEDIKYLNINNGETEFDEIAILQKCFCDIPFHKLTETFSLDGVGKEFETLNEIEKEQLRRSNTHPAFYGEFGIAFSKGWGEKNDLQPVQYLNSESSYTKELSVTIQNLLEKEDLPEFLSQDIINRLSTIKPLRGKMKREFEHGEVKYYVFNKNFHDEKEWRFVPNFDVFPIEGLSSLLANKDLIHHINDLNRMIESEDCKCFWLPFIYDDIRYLIVPDTNARIELIDIILNIPDTQMDKPELSSSQKHILISKILVLDEIKGDW